MPKCFLFPMSDCTHRDVASTFCSSFWGNTKRQGKFRSKKDKTINHTLPVTPTISLHPPLFSLSATLWETKLWIQSHRKGRCHPTPLLLHWKALSCGFQRTYPEGEAPGYLVLLIHQEPWGHWKITGMCSFLFGCYVPGAGNQMTSCADGIQALLTHWPLSSGRC